MSLHGYSFRCTRCVVNTEKNCGTNVIVHLCNEQIWIDQLFCQTQRLRRSTKLQNLLLQQVRVQLRACRPSYCSMSIVFAKVAVDHHHNHLSLHEYSFRCTWYVVNIEKNCGTNIIMPLCNGQIWIDQLFCQTQRLRRSTKPQNLLLQQVRWRLRACNYSSMNTVFVGYSKVSVDHHRRRHHLG